jgi:hypothetical protein
MTPGEYLRKRREAAGVGLAEAEAAVPIASVAAIEADEFSVTIHAAACLARLFSFDVQVLLEIAAGMPVEICSECGCTELDPCDPPCWWTAPDLCSACADGLAA